VAARNTEGANGASGLPPHGAARVSLHAGGVI
jgi:hypothetical protein